MLGLGTILSVMGGINTAFDLYKNVGILVNGDGTARLLDAMHEIREEVVQLKENIYFAPQLRGVSDTALPSRALGDLRTVCQVLEPVQRAVGGNIVSSRLINAPQRMEQALCANPWAVLVDVRPFNLAVRPTNPDMVPVMFVHGGMRYIGWQMRGALPSLFNCEWHDLPALGEGVQKERRPSISIDGGRRQVAEPSIREVGLPRQQMVLAERKQGSGPPAINQNRHAQLLSKESREARLAAERAQRAKDMIGAGSIAKRLHKEREEDEKRGITRPPVVFTAEDRKGAAQIIAKIQRSIQHRQWYVVREGKQYGPMREAEFPAIMNGLQGSDLVWFEELPDWQPADEHFPNMIKRGFFSWLK